MPSRVSISTGSLTIREDAWKTTRNSLVETEATVRNYYKNVMLYSQK